MSERSVRECMHEEVASCPPDTALEEVAAIMRDRDVGAVVLVDEGVAVGVISRTDLVNAAFIQPYMHFWRGMAARHLMSSPVVSVRPDATVSTALELLRSRRIRRLVVTEPTPAGERPVGILSLSDVAGLLGVGAAGEAAGKAG